ncbi:TIGR02757 family protein [Cytophaga aurantiaca]|uniref:TIGR02757 family protein n=1 Tax=Cytophaga aurantiaca TaxID=29530 RepID=UPI00035F3CBB|nr:TIGR02757 family protein [Cytophaga aurantiaca]
MNKYSRDVLYSLLESKYKAYNTKDFIAFDPVCIPHRFSKKEDIEIMGFIASILAWGQRKTIINKCSELIERMDGAPHQFILHHQDTDLKQLEGFVHRTFNDTDLLYFIFILKEMYTEFSSMEDVFMQGMNKKSENVEGGLIAFRNYFFSFEHPTRTLKHISSPEKKSACKRLNMFLRWMVRQDKKGVDFGIWTKIQPAQLICPCDVHVDRIARQLGLITRTQTDWKTAVELTNNLKKLDPKDPVKYDFALFGMGVIEGMI